VDQSAVPPTGTPFTHTWSTSSMTASDSVATRAASAGVSVTRRRNHSAPSKLFHSGPQASQ